VVPFLVALITSFVAVKFNSPPNISNYVAVTSAEAAPVYVRNIIEPTPAPDVRGIINVTNEPPVINIQTPERGREEDEDVPRAEMTSMPDVRFDGVWDE
jgi:hypothetical protein